VDDEFRRLALALYRGPFRYERGYVWDANMDMVADTGGYENSVMRVRGWGHIQRLPDPEKLQDAVGELMAEALTDLWRREHEARRG